MAEVFDGVKILDFTWIVAGPMLVKYLAEHGAQVVHVETSRKHPDPTRTSPPFKEPGHSPDHAAYFVLNHSNQWSLDIDLEYPEAVQVIRKLVAWADIVVENFTPGVMKRMGLGYEELAEINPRIIMVSSSQQGQTGPRAFLPGTGNQLTALSGFSHIAGWPDREPALLYGGYTDCQAARIGAVTLIAALIHRNRTGKGQLLDISQYEAGVNFIAPVYFDYLFNGHIANREGNRSPSAAPHGVYPCAGEDRWCAIAVSTDAEWSAFCTAAGNPQWQTDPRFAGILDRKRHEDELDKLVAAWTLTLSPEDVTEKLQKAGVPSGIVESCRDLMNDPQLKHRNYYWEVDHPVIGKHRYDSQAFELSRTPRRLRNPAPMIGEHNYFVCSEILGMSGEEFADLVAKGILGQ